MPAQLFLYAALNSLAALGDSVNVMTTTYVPHVLARAAMEAGSQALTKWSGKWTYRVSGYFSLPPA
jgi:hypothetical protein